MAPLLLAPGGGAFRRIQEPFGSPQRFPIAAQVGLSREQSGFQMEVHMVSKETVKGTAQKAAGSIKEAAGKATGDRKLQAKGIADRAAGSAKKAVGKTKDAVHKATR